MQSGMFVVVCMVSIFNCMPGISASLFSVWLCLERQSGMNRSGLDLYMILTLYWCILSRINCILCGNCNEIVPYMMIMLCLVIMIYLFCMHVNEMWGNTSASAYIHNKHCLLLTHAWLPHVV